MKTVDILGNNFSSLFLAHKLINENVRVNYFLDGGKAAGHFAGLRWAENLFDIGMVFLEQPSEQDSNDQNFEDLSAAKRFDWLRYGQALNQEIEKLFSPVPADPVKVLYKRKLYADYLISDKLDMLSQFGLSLPDMFGNPKYPIHARYKNHPDCYNDIALSEASIFNHGEEMHTEMILPFLEKLTQKDPMSLMAKFHRVLWLPLYWPETIIQTLAGSPQSLREYKFFKTASGSIAEKITFIEAQVKSARNINIISDPILRAKWKIGLIELETENNSFNIQPDCIVLGLNRFCQVFGLHAPKVSDTEDLAIGFFLVDRELLPAKPFSVINVLDKEYKIYRISNQGNCSQNGNIKLSVEANLKVLKPSGSVDDLKDIFTAELAQIFSTHPSKFGRGKIVVAKDALVLPTFSNVATHEQKTREISYLFSGVNFTGHLLGYNLASLNDQMAQALQLYFKLRPDKRKGQ